MKPILEQQVLSAATLHPHILQAGVLVVDDSDLQRSVAVEILRSIGVASVYEANSGLQALNLLHAPGIQPAIILLDLHMPGMDGIELIQEVARVNPCIAVIVVSGADIKLLETLGSLVCACNMQMLGALPKPLNGQALVRSLRSYQRPSPQPLSDSSSDQISVADLKRAIRLGHIQPYYQAKVSLKQGRVKGFEALARWRDPQKGIIMPGCFIDLATEHQLLKDLTLKMLDTLLADMTAWKRLDMFPVISLNIAVSLLEDRSFANQIIRCVNNSDISPRKILLEITEGALIKDQAAALATIGRLRLQGFGFSIDDYGTGFASMQQLSRIAFDELKIDRSFVSRAIESEHVCNILQSAVATGQRLGLTTVAEGVETVEQLNLLRDMGCDEIQGYLIAKAMPAADVLPWLNHNATKIAMLCRGENISE